MMFKPQRLDPSRRSFVLAAAAAPMLLQACAQGPNYTGPSVVLKWNETALSAVRAGTLAPPMVARALAILYTSMYDAWAPYDRKAVATQEGGPLRLGVPKEFTNLLAVKEKALSYAAYEALKDIYPEQQASFNAAMGALGFDPQAILAADDPGQMGREAAKRLLAYRHTDGSNQLGDLAVGAYADYTGYKPVNTVTTVSDPNRWQPLKFSNGRSPGFIVPHWGSIKPFALSTGSEYRLSVSLPQFGTKAYKDQADLVLNYTANLTDQQKVIAEYWANGPKSETPPGQWHKIAAWISTRDLFDLDTDLKMFFLLSNAVMDASISCWECKRYYDSVRPITAIRTLYAGQQIKGLVSAQDGIGLMPGELWHPYQLATFSTPPFAEFVSGHSTFSSAGAEILRRYTGSDAYGESVTLAPGSSAHQVAIPKQAVSLKWDTFTAAAQEAGLSRLLGGIHFDAGNEVGQSMGGKVAAKVWEKALRLLNGLRT
jgi:hypothetical protein